MKQLAPPKWALSFLRWYCREEYLDEIEGDLFEMFHVRSLQSPKKAQLFFVWNVLRSFRMINFKKTQLLNNWTMNLFKNYTKIYFRRFKKETGHYLVNMLGLAMGFTILFFIVMYVYDEQNIDGYHNKKDRIYRVINEVQDEDGLHHYLSIPGPMADALKQEYPAIEETAHLTYSGSQVLAEGDKRFADREWAIATPSIFKILDFEIVEGNPMKTFNGPTAMVVTEEQARRLFGRTDVVGEVIDEANFGPAEVIAVMKEMPRNASYRFNNIYVANYEQFPERWANFINSWRGRFAQTWVLFKEGTGPEQVLGSRLEFMEKYVPEETREGMSFRFQNIADMHLGSQGIETGGMNPRLSIPYSDQRFVTVVLLLGFLVIFIAALNYINLSSVQALKRTMEASMRKINGANNRSLVIQLFFETFLTLLFAYAIGIAMVIALFPFFLEITEKTFGLDLLYTMDLVPLHLGVFMIIWVFSAMIPALYYSKLKRSLLILKNAFSGKGDALRKVLVGVQYALAIFLIIGSMVIYRQMNYVQTKNLGFSNEQLIVLDINSGNARRSFKEILQGIKTNANVINATTSSRVPGEWKNLPTANMSMTLTDQPIEASHYGVDHNWLDTYQMKLKAGKNFSGDDQADSLSILINSQTAKMLELDDPVGQSIWVMSRRDSVKMRVIGIVEDFHFQSLFEKIGPVVITNWHNHVLSIDYFTIRYASNPKETIAHIEEVNATFDPETPPEINFLDEQWERYYKAEESRATILLIASIVSILISAFGLFGLINFTVERKTKEIGIRKVMGAPVMTIIRLILKDYVVLLSIALLVAGPVAWWLFESWLADFAYRIDLSADLFIISFFIVILVSFSTVLGRISKIAKDDPVNVIRYE